MMGEQSTMTLVDDSWTEEQAQGLLDSLRIAGVVPDWKPEHLQKLYDWCSAHEKDHKPSKANLNSSPTSFATRTRGFGMALQLAQTRKEASKAVEPYVKALREDREWFRGLKSGPGDNGEG
jgi:hypothetical protein